MPARISRATYADMYGPTTGDRLRLADTDLIIEVERDLTTYGEEVKFGGGKVIRDGMGQSQIPRSGGAADTVITNALILDHSGIYKADVGLRDGRILKIGKAGNPDTQPNVTIIIGPGTEIIAGEGRILTAGGMDAHIHFICPQQIEDALHSGLTTMLGGGTGPAHGTLATTCTPGPWHIMRMMQAADAFGVVALGIVNGGQGTVELFAHLGAMPFFRLERFQNFLMAAEFVMNGGEILDTLLGVVEFTLDQTGGPGDFLDEITLSGDETFLFDAQGFEVLLLAFDLLLLAPEFLQLLLSSLDFGIDILKRGGNSVAVHEFGSIFKNEEIILVVAVGRGESGCFAGDHGSTGNYFQYPNTTDVLSIPDFSSAVWQKNRECLQKPRLAQPVQPEQPVRFYHYSQPWPRHPA